MTIVTELFNIISALFDLFFEGIGIIVSIIVTSLFLLAPYIAALFILRLLF